MLRDRFGDVIGTAFLVGFFATSFSSILGVWHGVSLMFADFVDTVRGGRRLPDESTTRRPAFRAYLLWLLNTDRTPGEHRNGWLSNTVLTVSAALFAVLAVTQIRDLF